MTEGDICSEISANNTSIISSSFKNLAIFVLRHTLIDRSQDEEKINFTKTKLDVSF